jgi:hypothetical protein
MAGQTRLNWMSEGSQSAAWLGWPPCSIGTPNNAQNEGTKTERGTSRKAMGPLSTGIVGKRLELVPNYPEYAGLMLKRHCVTYNVTFVHSTSRRERRVADSEA